MNRLISILEGYGNSIILWLAIAASIFFLAWILKTVLRFMQGFSQAVHSVTDRGVEGWAAVKKVYRTQEILAGNTLYFLDLDIQDDSGDSYSITVLHPLRRCDLGFFIPGSRIPVKSSAEDRFMVIFPQIDYRKLHGFLFYNENSDDWKKALKTKDEISLRLADTEQPLWNS
jgi:hypothetical protein